MFHNWTATFEPYFRQSLPVQVRTTNARVVRSDLYFASPKRTLYQPLTLLRKEAVMAESQLELNKNRMKQLGKFAQVLPDVLGQVRDMTNEVYKDGELSCKVKRLMAMAIALGAGCRNCVLGQAMYALENGATKEEILETISVVVSMRGTTGVAESLRIVQLLDELGKL
jgi:AhpD family alkylhydroperoxidase